MTRLKVLKKGQRSSKPFSLQEWHESFGEVLIMGLVQPGRDPRREWRGAGVFGLALHRHHHGALRPPVLWEIKDMNSDWLPTFRLCTWRRGSPSLQIVTWLTSRA